MVYKIIHSFFEIIDLTTLNVKFLVLFNISD